MQTHGPAAASILPSFALKLMLKEAELIENFGNNLQPPIPALLLPSAPDSRRAARRRIFAIVARPRVDLGGKVIRRILIFDNHPDSLRLVLNSGVDADRDDTSRRQRRTSIICVFILIAMLIAAVLWPLCF